MRLLPRAEREEDVEEKLEPSGRQFKEKSWRGGGRREEGGEGGHYWMTNTSIIAPPLPPRASGLGEEVMTPSPDTAESHNGILPASTYTSLMRMRMMMMSSAGTQSLSEQTLTLSSLTHLGLGGRCWVTTLHFL